jgi:RNA ligase (TIGR02306 family)
MSTLKVEVVGIDSVEKHPNADRLELANIKGWQCIIGKGNFKAGDSAVYFPIDSILPPELEYELFPPESKIKLHKSRVRTIKIRGAISQGLLIPLDDLGFDEDLPVGYDCTEQLGVIKYEPPVKAATTGGQATSPKRTNPFFYKYTDIENFKNYPKLFDDEETIICQEKVHGTNFRAGWVPFYAYTWWDKIKVFFRIAPKWKFVYGSHRVQLQDKFLYTGFYDKNVYSEATVKYNLQNLLLPGQVVYGEIYGSGVQKGYTYGLGEGERKLVIFDVKIDNRYLDFGALDMFCIVRGLKMPPLVYTGRPPGNDKLKEYTEGESLLGPTAFGREGIVIRPELDKLCFMGRKILKFKSDTFLLKAEDDTH